MMEFNFKSILYSPNTKHIWTMFTTYSALTISPTKRYPNHYIGHSDMDGPFVFDYKEGQLSRHFSLENRKMYMNEGWLEFAKEEFEIFVPDFVDKLSTDLMHAQLAETINIQHPKQNN